MLISRRAQEIQASPIRKLKPLADEAKKRGIHIFHLNIGDPDIPTPRPVIEAFQAYHDPILGYGPSQGFDELRQAIVDYFRDYGINLTVDNVLITIGGSEAIHFSFSVVADPGEEIIIPEPFYTNYNGFATFADVKIVPLSLKVEDGFRLPPVEEIEALITPKTRAILLCSPNNPTGTVYTEEELQRVVDLVRKHDLFLIGDEVYKEFVYDGLKHKSLLEFKEVEDRVIVVDSISKRFSCCGARIGAVVTRNKEVYQAILKFAQARLCPPSVEQYAAIAAYKMGMDYFEPIRQEYQRRRDVLYEGLTSIPGVVLRQPKGAFYAFCRLPIKDSEHFVRWMLTDFSVNQKTVMVAPGPGFYATPGRGQDEVRIAYVLKEEDLVEAIEILRQGLEKYRRLFA
ncbi:MAG TPA: pyridoxal phosphate-dependent aminotransferase [Candidatus Saccharicenans sp.]|jgi:aspartate aminotransferase|nr:pyridoxal phosphate-dependent aminotransferase [Candidatus Saccharicenans sp.]HOT69104.1 pyridoxal phosphate-dependent aminotransferase [Candidatus Saccharicenans sp.]HQH61177.1 pyridoxal phosphate-dependent aminotransferase [Candidatus Saccharicenans sp.]